MGYDCRLVREEGGGRGEGIVDLWGEREGGGRNRVRGWLGGMLQRVGDRRSVVRFCKRMVR